MHQVTSVESSARPYAAPYEQIGPGDLSLTGLECLLREVSILGASAGQRANWPRCLTTATESGNREERQGGTEPCIHLKSAAKLVM